MLDDHYGILNIGVNSTPEEIKAAYHKAAKTHHPDRNGSRDMFLRVKQAYDILSDETRRARYDAEHERTPDPVIVSPHRPIKLQIQIPLVDIFHGTVYPIRFRSPDGEIGETILPIPAGMADGSVIKVMNIAEKGTRLFVELVTLPDAKFQRHSQNLHTRIEVSALDILLGESHTIKGIDGAEIMIPLRDFTGKPFRVQGHGMTVYRIKPRGDLLVEIVPVYPSLDDDQIQLLRRAKEIDTSRGNSPQSEQVKGMNG